MKRSHEDQHADAKVLLPAKHGWELLDLPASNSVGKNHRDFLK
jgi:hypothetical protein